MKFYIVLFTSILLLLINSNTYAQIKGDLSYSFDCSYIHYRLNSSNYSVEFQNNFNYEVNTKFFYGITNNFSAGLGLGFQNMDYFFLYNQPNNSNSSKREFYAKNLNIFFPISFRKVKIKNIGLYINSAVVINYILQYNIRDIYTDGSNITYNDIDFEKRDGLTYRFSIDFVRNFNKKISLAITPFLNYKFQFEKLSYWDHKKFHLNNSSKSYGFSIGIIF